MHLLLCQHVCFSFVSCRCLCCPLCRGFFIWLVPKSLRVILNFILPGKLPLTSCTPSNGGLPRHSCTLIPAHVSVTMFTLFCCYLSIFNVLLAYYSFLSETWYLVQYWVQCQMEWRVRKEKKAASMLRIKELLHVTHFTTASSEHGVSTLNSGRPYSKDSLT